MGKMPYLSMLAFITASVLYFYFGVYVLRKTEICKKTSKVFFFQCMVLVIWSVSCALSITSPDLKACIFWNKISFAGYMLTSGIMLHLTLLVSKGKSSRIKYVSPFIYVPATMAVCILEMSDKYFLSAFNLINTANGWIAVGKESAPYTFFYLYGLIFIASAIFMFWRFEKFSAEKNSRIIAKVSMCSILISLVINIFCNSIINLPLMQPVFLLMPIAIVFYTVKFCEFFDKPDETDNWDAPKTTLKIKVYRAIAYIFISICIIDLSMNIFNFNKSEFLQSLLFNLILLALGIFIIVIANLKLNERIKDNIIVFIVSAAIPLVTLQHIKAGSVVFWAFPFLMIIGFIVFTSNEDLILLAISVFATQISIWILYSDTTVHLKNADYLVRIVLFIAAIYMAYCINQLYLSRIKENEEQIRAQHLIAEIAADLVTADSFNIENKINAILNKIGKFFKADRICLYRFDRQNRTMVRTNELDINGIFKDQKSSEKIIFNEILPWTIEKIKNNEVVYFPDINLMPEEIFEEKQMFLKKNINSLIYIPLANMSKTIGFLGFDSVKPNPGWSENNIKILKIICSILSEALVRIEAEEKQEYMAYYDPLTDLPNRALFRDRVEQAALQANRTGNIFAVMMIDLDSFKLINDSLGHEKGDELLKHVSQELLACVRKSDTVARFGGDEFLVLINNVLKKEDIIKVAEKIINIFTKPFNVGLQEFFVTASGGIAVYPVDGRDVDELIKNADVAMYKAKEKGKNQFVFCASDMKGEVSKVMELSNSLYYAQEYNELSLYYQPQIDIKSNEIVGVETLLRWKHPKMGMVLPAKFIPIAEKTGLINSIGEWVIENACIQNVKWQKIGLKPIRVAVNVSFVQLRNPKLIDQIQGILNKTGMDPKYLELEITESVAMLEPKYNISVLSKLKDLGLSIAIDDFGTEYSSLSRLRQLPIDRIKMDIQFVQAIEKSETDKAFAEAIISLAKCLGLKVIAEGVETKYQLDFLKQKNCDEVQGYYFYEPKPADEIKWILVKSEACKSDKEKSSAANIQIN